MDQQLEQEHQTKQEGHVIESSEILDMYEVAKNFVDNPRRLLVLDYDGTLTPLVNNPEAAVPDDQLLHLLKDLARDPKTNIWLVSGRKQAFLDKNFGRIKSLGLAAEHGCFVRYPEEEGHELPWEPFLECLDTRWIEAVVQPIFEKLTIELPGSEVELKESAIVWHYRNADQTLGLEKAKQLKVYLEERLQLCEIDVSLGSNILEVKPQAINKGTLISVLLHNWFGDSDKGFVFCAGDDTTDEG